MKRITVAMLGLSFVLPMLLCPSRVLADTLMSCGRSCHLGWAWSFSIPKSSRKALPEIAARRVRPNTHPSTTRLGRFEVVGLAEHCAPTTPSATLASIAAVESGGDPLTLRDNVSGVAYHPASLQTAVDLAQTLIHQSSSVDVGLLQINSRNFDKLGLTARTALSACSNLAAAGRMLNENYARAVSLNSNAPLLQTAYSIYNTGKPTRGFHNGYTGKVVAASQRRILPKGSRPL